MERLNLRNMLAKLQGQHDASQDHAYLENKKKCKDCKMIQRLIKKLGYDPSE